MSTLAVTAIEVKYFGESYTDHVVKNAKTFAEVLIAKNSDHTKSHMYI